MGGKDGLQPVQKNRVRLVYQTYLDDRTGEYADSGGSI